MSRDTGLSSMVNTWHAALFITLVELHGPNGQRYFLNPYWITTIREPVTADLKHFSTDTHCVVVTTNGRFLAVRETCDQVRALVSKPKP